MKATVHKITSENGQTHDGSHIYAHDRHCRAILPVPAERGYSSYARRRPIAWFGPHTMERAHPDGEAGTWLAKHNVVWERVCSMPTSEIGTTSLQRTRDLSPMSVIWRFHCILHCPYAGSTLAASLRC